MSSDTRLSQSAPPARWFEYGDVVGFTSPGAWVRLVAIGTTMVTLALYSDVFPDFQDVRIGETAGLPGHPGWLATLHEVKPLPGSGGRPWYARITLSEGG